MKFNDFLNGVIVLTAIFLMIDIIIQTRQVKRKRKNDEIWLNEYVEKPKNDDAQEVNWPTTVAVYYEAEKDKNSPKYNPYIDSGKRDE